MMRGTPEALGAWLLEQAEGSAIGAELELYRHLWENEPAPGIRDLPVEADAHRLDQSGWGVVWTKAGEERLRPLLEPLLARRQQQAGARYRELVSAGPRESAAILLARYDETLGIIRPDDVPYYLLILGGPEEIPFEVQYHLSLNHAVGRLAFGSDDDYTTYARHVCAAERGEARAETAVGLFSVENDPATRLFGERLITPLAEMLKGYREGWGWVEHRGPAATRAELETLLSEPSPALLILSSHGRSIAAEREDQEARQGAILCAPEGDEVVAPEDLELRGEHLSAADDALLGQVCFLFSCYAAGTPVLDSYPFKPKAAVPPERARPVLARRPLVASLAQELLERGTLGVVGHVDRSWSLSFAWVERYRDGATTSILELNALASLEDSLKRLLGGERLGHALRSLHKRFAFLSGRLVESFDRLARLHGQHSATDLERLGYLWTGVNDARNMILLGDPAVYLRGRRSAPGLYLRLPSELMRELEREAEARSMTSEQWVEHLIRRHLPLGASREFDGSVED